MILSFGSLALSDASQPSRWPHGVNGGADAWSLVWRREHGHAAGDGASRNGSLEETFPSSASTTTAAGGPRRPKTRVNSLCGKEAGETSADTIKRARPQFSGKGRLRVYDLPDCFRVVQAVVI